MIRGIAIIALCFHFNMLSAQVQKTTYSDSVTVELKKQISIKIPQQQKAEESLFFNKGITPIEPGRRDTNTMLLRLKLNYNYF